MIGALRSSVHMKALHAAAYVSAAYAKPSGILTYSGAGGSSSVPLAARAEG